MLPMVFNLCSKGIFIETKYSKITLAYLPLKKIEICFSMKRKLRQLTKK